MKSSGNKVVTPTLVKKYLQQKGLGTVGDAVVDKIASTSDAVGMDRKEPPLTRGTTPSNGASNLRAPTAPPAAAPAGAPTLRAPDRNPLAPQTKSKTNSGEEYTWLGAQWRSVQTGRMANKAQGAELKQNAQKQTNSMYSEAVDEAGLSKRQIRNILKQVIEKAYGDNAGFKRSKFGDASASTSSQDDVQGMISKLKAAGYKVSR
jgi:hypothetical protein